MKKLTEIGLSLGSNMGDRLANLNSACEDLNRYEGITVVSKSRIYETEPVGVEDKYQYALYYNAFVVIKTVLSLSSLLDVTKKLENNYGRDLCSEKNSPRPLDIDIIYVGDLTFNRDKIKVPHERWYERRFVVQPLVDVRPDIIIPGQSETAEQILKKLPEEPYVRYAEETSGKF
jgi:2-amino-4-hydroxy-6-hydroxymethyldihydropteridine diphosphokinase